ncbi:MAG: DUF4132 domain-containing protein [Thermosynechococcaceae cyanobacterium]
MGKFYSVLGRAMERRSLRYTDAKSDKFWTITLEGISHTVEYGRMGTTGQSQTKEFGSEAEAQKSFQKLLQEKLKKGYVEVEATSEASQADLKPATVQPQAAPAPSQPSVVLEPNQDICSVILAQLTQNKKALCELAAMDAIPDAFMPLLDLEIRVAIAQQEHTADRLFQNLAMDVHDKVRQALAKNSQAPSRVLEQLAKDKSLDVRTALAKNPDAPPQALAELGKDSYSAVRKAVAKHLNTPGEVLLDMIHELPAYNGNSIERSLWVPRLAAERRYTSPETLSQLAKHDDQSIRTFVARHLNTPISVLELLANDAQFYVRRSVAENPNTPLDLLIKLAKDSEPYACAGVAANVNTPAYLLEELSLVGDMQINYCLVKNPNITNEILRNIFRYSNSGGFELVIRHPNLPADVLEELADHRDKSVRLEITKNPNTPAKGLEKLASDVTQSSYRETGTVVILRFEIQEAVAANPNTPLSVLEQLFQAKDLFVCRALTGNAKIPGVWLEHLAEAQDFKINTPDNNLSEAQKHTFYNDYYEVLLRKIASHPNTPIEVLKKLSEHSSKRVCFAAKTSLTPQNKPNKTSDKELKPQEMPDRWQGLLKPSKSLHRFLVLHDIQLQRDLLKKVSCSSEWHDRYAITQNPSISTEILQKLAQDAEPIVQSAAKAALGLEAVIEIPNAQVEITQVSEQAEPAEIASKAPEPNAVAEKLEIVRSLNLNPTDWLWATWIPLNPIPRSPVKPFDLEKCLKQLQQIPCTSHSCFDFNWTKSKLSIDMPPAEAHFWLSAMMCDMPGNNGPDARFGKMDQADLADYLRSQNLSQTPDLHRICVFLIRDYRRIRPQIVLPIFNAFSFVEFCTTVFSFQQLSTDSAIQYLTRYLGESYIESYVAARNWLTRKDSLGALVHVTQQDVRHLLGILVRGFKDYIWPYLDHQDTQVMIEQLRPVLNTLPSGSPLYFLAAYLGMEEVRTYLDTWKVSAGKYLRTDESIEIIFGAGDAQLVEAYARTLWIGLGKPEYIRGWLANTQFGALDWICRSLLKSYPSQTTDLLQAFTESVQAPEAAPYMLELWLKLKKSQLARQWLEDNPTHAVIGLIPIAAGQNVSPIEAKPAELTKAAIAFLTSLKRKGYESLIRAALEQQPLEIAEKVKALVLDQDDTNLLPFDEKTTPQWLKDGIADLPKQKRSQHPDWISAADLPALVVGDRCLSEAQTHACLCALKLSTLESPALLVKHLKTYANPQSLDGFIWSLFERWLTEGGSAKEKWAMFALGLLGSDAIALKLTPLIRNWPGENQHPRAVLGLECLRTIGSDTALMQINGIAQKTKYQGLQARAEECMEAVARDRQLTQDQLEDRIIPDCGLDATGKRVFDFGPRQFHFALGADLKPLVKEEKGKPLSTLPKAGAKDDVEKAQQAIAEWKLLKKQVSEIVKIQSVRLEDAMITERRWPWAEFATLLVQHPLLTHLVQRLIWGSYSPDETLTQTFRVSEDKTYADCNDITLVPEESTFVGIVHPIDLNEDLKAQWGQTLSDYEIIPPFPQINRDVYTLTPAEMEAEEIKRFQEILIPGERLAYRMEKLGWQRGGLHDHGDYKVHYKDFDQGKVTAVVGDYECQHVEKSSIWGADAIDGCLFLVGQHREPYEYPAPGSWAEKHTQGKRLPLRDVHPLVISEVLRDLTAIATAP